MIYRGWRKLNILAEKSNAAKAVLDNFQNEFRRRFFRRLPLTRKSRVAKQLVEGFISVPDGTCNLGTLSNHNSDSLESIQGILHDHRHLGVEKIRDALDRHYALNDDVQSWLHSYQAAKMRIKHS